MNLSRFYKANKSFKPKAVLDTTTSKEPVWGSIIKDETPVPESPADTIQEPTTPDVESHEVAHEISQPLLQTDESEQEIISEEINEETEGESLASAPLPETAIDVETIRENAFTSGIIAGREQAEEDFENVAQTLLSICNELDRLRETILRNSATEMKELVLAISERVIRHSVKDQEETVIATIKDAINLAVKSDEFQIQINPEDLQVVNSRKNEIINSISGLENIVLKSDSNIERGGCKLESTCCTVDASITSQIKVIHDSIMAPDILSSQNESDEALEA